MPAPRLLNGILAFGIKEQRLQGHWQPPHPSTQMVPHVVDCRLKAPAKSHRQINSPPAAKQNISI